MSPSMCAVPLGVHETSTSAHETFDASGASPPAGKRQDEGRDHTKSASGAVAEATSSPPPSPKVPPPAVPLCRPPSLVTTSTAADDGVAAPPNGTATAAAAATTITVAAAAAVDWSRVRLGVDAAPTMFVATWSAEAGRWDGGKLVPYGPLNLMPAAQVLNYGQSIFEGLKAYRYDGPDADGDAGSAAAASGASGGHRVLLFRADANAARFEAGARRMCMPPVPPAMFLEAVQAVVRANAAWVPPAARGSLYLRPLLLGTGPLLGLCPAPSYTFLVYAIPVGQRAKDGRLSSLDYLIHDSLHRAAPRGVGSTKAAGNYSPCLMAQEQARAQGCNDCIYLDAKSDTYLEEGSGCNVFAVHGSVLSTPPAAGSILPGVTRASLLQLAAALGYRVREAPVSVEEAMRADEMFSSGTAVVVQPVGSVTFKGRRVQFGRRSAAAVDGSSTTAANGCANGYANGHANGQEAGSSDGCAADTSNEAGPTAEDAEDVSYEVSVSYGSGRAAGELLPEERAALAAFAPVPEPGSLPPGVGPVAQRLYSLLTGIQYGRTSDPFGWTVEVDMRGPTEGALHLDQLLEPQSRGPAGQQQQEEQTPGGDRDGKAAPALLKAKPQAKSVFADPNLE